MKRIAVIAMLMAMALLVRSTPAWSQVGLDGHQRDGSSTALALDRSGNYFPYGGSPNNPLGYHQQSFAGVVTAVDDVGRTFTLSMQGKKKVETFVAFVEDKCCRVTIREADGSLRGQVIPDLKPSQLGIGSRVRAYYIPKTVKSAKGDKSTVNTVFWVDVAK
jgi:hypothetical protein